MSVTLNHEPLYAAARIETLADHGGFVVLKADNEAPVTIDRQSYAVLQSASCLLSLHEHIERAATCHGISTDNAKRIFARFIGINYVRSNSGSVAPNPDNSHTRCEISSIVVVTKDRPKSLLRCLESIGANTTVNGRTPRIRIYDDSINEDSRKVTQTFQQTEPRLHIEYSGRNEKHEYLRQLHALSSIPLHVLNFAFTGTDSFGPAYGANQNCAMADTAGEAILTIDDDVLCRIASRTENPRHLAVRSAFDVTSTRLFASRAEALSDIHWTSVDVLHTHEQMLGRRIPSLFTDFESIDQNSVPMRSPNVENVASRSVATTMNGIVGNSAMGNSPWIRWTGPIQRQLLHSRSTYEALRDTSEIVRSVAVPTISEGQFFMTTMAGLDNRDLLPPFPPVLRNQDGVFGCLLRTCWPDKVIGHLPWVALHDPMPDYRRSTSAGVPGMRFAELVMSVIRAIDFRFCGSNPQTRLARVAHELNQLSDIEEGAFTGWLANEWGRHVAADLLWHRQLLENSENAIAEWRRDMETRIDAIQAALAAWSPSVIDTVDAASRGHNQLRKLLNGYGQLIRYWPAIISAAKDLAAKRIWMSQKIAAKQAWVGAGG